MLIVGADAFLGLPTWHRWRELFDLAHLVVVARPGVDARAILRAAPARAEWQARHRDRRGALAHTPAGAIYLQAITPHPISATAIREALARGARGTRRGTRIAPARRFGLY